MISNWRWHLNYPQCNRAIGAECCPVAPGVWRGYQFRVRCARCRRSVVIVTCSPQADEGGQ